MAAAPDDPAEAYRRGDYAKAIALLTARAGASDSTAEAILGHMYLAGQGVTKDGGTAVVWLQKAAAHGNVLAAFDLGVIFATGNGVSQDLSAAVHWYTIAAHEQSAEAAYSLSVFYRDGRGVARDPILALAWLNAAIDFLDYRGVDRKERFEAVRDALTQTMSRDEIERAHSLDRSDGPVMRAIVRNRAVLEKLSAKAYPDKARRWSHQGIVIMLIRVTADGHVQDTTLEFTSGFPELDAVTLKMLSQGEFEPKRLDGRPVDSWQQMKWVWRIVPN